MRCRAVSPAEHTLTSLATEKKGAFRPRVRVEARRRQERNRSSRKALAFPPLTYAPLRNHLEHFSLRRPPKRRVHLQPQPLAHGLDPRALVGAEDCAHADGYGGGVAGDYGGKEGGQVLDLVLRRRGQVLKLGLFGLEVGEVHVQGLVEEACDGGDEVGAARLVHEGVAVRRGGGCPFLGAFLGAFVA